MNVGDKIGHWEIIEYIGKNKDKASLWRCRCNCGAERVLTVSYINFQHKKGYQFCRECKSREEDLVLIPQLVGKKIGTWEIISLKDRNKYGTRRWLCRCDCGQKKLFYTSYLQGEYKRKATTCLSCTKRNLELDNRVVDLIPQRFWQKFLHVANRRNIKIEITKEQAFKKYQEQDGKCALSGLSLYFTKLRTHFNRYTNASIDRIDSAKFYTLANIQWLEKRVNMMKQAYKQDEFLELCKLVVENQFDN